MTNVLWFALKFGLENKVGQQALAGITALGKYVCRIGELGLYQTCIGAVPDSRPA
jgi:hypothetical protein